MMLAVEDPAMIQCMSLTDSCFSKSRIAIEYSYRVRKAAPDTWVFWVTFNTPAAVAQDFRKIAKAVGLRGWDEKAVDIFTMVRDWLKDESNGPWTMILDNVDSVDVLTAPAPKVASSISVDDASPIPQIRNFITTSTRGSVLVTSRNTEAAQMITGNCAYHIDVDEMNESEAIALLKKKLNSKVTYTEAEAAELVKTVDFMPLAISQIATNISINYPRLTISKAIERIRTPSEETVQLLETSAHETSRDTNRTNSIVKTWHLSLQYVRQTNPSAARLLSLMCLFGRQSIPETLLTGQYGEEVTASTTPFQPRFNWWNQSRRQRFYLRRRQRAAQQREAGDKTIKSACFDEDWRVLSNFALIKTNVDGCHFNMHRLVQYTTKRWLEINGELKAWMQKYVAIIRDYFPKPEHDNWKVCQYLFPHARQAANYRPEDRALLVTWARLIQMVSRFAYVIGDHTSAENLGRTALAALEEVQGSHCEDTLCSYHQLGLAISVLNRYNESEKMFRRAYEGRLALLGPDHLDTLDSANNLGARLNKQKKYEEGEAMHMRAVEGYERVYGPGSVEIQSLMAGLVLTYITNERVEQATAIHRRVHGIRKEAYGEETDDAYHGLRALGALLNMQGKAAEAEDIHRRVVDYRSKRSGFDHSETIKSVNFLCGALIKQRKLEEAVTRYRSVIDLYTDLDEKARHEALLTMNSLAETLIQQGHLEEAETVCRRLVLESERLLGADDCDTLVGVHTLADILAKQNRYEEALTSYERAYVGTEKRCGAGHPDTKEFLEDFNHAKKNIPV
jgi:tetratricopeptide (TPR) repeat protein